MLQIERCRIRFGALVAAAGLHAASALAESPLVAYSAFEGCPSTSELGALIAAHLGSPPASDAAPVTISVVDLPDGVQARVSFWEPGGAEVTRALAAPTCAEVVSAAALVVALALDAHARAREIESAPEAAPGPVADAPMPVPGRDHPIEEPRPRAPESSPAPVWQLGAGVFAEGGVAPSPLLGASAFAGIGSELDWELRLHLAIGAATAERDDRSAEFRLLAGRADACALALLRTSRFVLHPCVAVELGSVHSQGVESERYSATARRVVWGAGGPLLRARGAFGALRLDASGGPWLPFAGTRTYVFEQTGGDAVFHTVPRVAWLAALHLGFALE